MIPAQVNTANHVLSVRWKPLRPLPDCGADSSRGLRLVKRHQSGPVETLHHRWKQGSTTLHLQVGWICNNLEKGKPRKARQVFLQIKTEAQCVVFKYNHCFSAGIPLFHQRQQWRGKAQKRDLEHCLAGGAQFPWPWSGHPQHWQLFPLCITHVSIPSPSIPLHHPAASPQEGHAMAKIFQLSVPSVKSSLTWSKGCVPAPRRLVAFLPTLFCAPTDLVGSWQQSCCGVPVIAFPMLCERSRSLLTSCYSFINPMSGRCTEWLWSRPEWCFVRQSLSSWGTCFPGSWVWFCGWLFKHSSWTGTISWSWWFCSSNLFCSVFFSSANVTVDFMILIYIFNKINP